MVTCYCSNNMLQGEVPVSLLADPQRPRYLYLAFDIVHDTLLSV